MTNLRRIVVLATALVAVAVPALVWLFGQSEPDTLNAKIQKLGFYPVTPPTTLRGPGTIYHVTPDGRSTSALCIVNPERLQPVLRTSYTEKTVSDELRKGSIGIKAELAAQARTHAEVELLQQVSYTLDGVQVYEVSLEELANIATELQQRPGCSDQIMQYLRSGDYVCQGAQVLLATASYSVSTKHAAETKTSVDSETLKSVIQANVDPKAHVTGSLKVGGEGLYYGMKLAPRCMALPGEVNRRPPVTWVDRMMSGLGLDPT